MIVMNIILGIVAFAVFLAFVRLLIGPTASDRVLALDTLTTITITVIVLIGLLMKRSIFMDVALVYAVIGFIGVVIVAKFLEGDV